MECNMFEQMCESIFDDRQIKGRIENLDNDQIFDMLNLVYHSIDVNLSWF